MSVQVQRLQPGEGERWRRIRLRALEEAPYAFSTRHRDMVQWSAERWEVQVVEFATFVAVVDGSDVGVARGAAHQRSDVRELISMWVAPSARRQGIAAQLIESVAAWAKASGASTLVLDVGESNAAAVALYERAGLLRFDGEEIGERSPGEMRFVRALTSP